MKFLCVAVFLIPAMTLAGTPEYKLETKISPDQKSMTVQGEMKFLPRQEARHELSFALSELIEDFQVEISQPFFDAQPRVKKTLRTWSRPGWGANTWTITPKNEIPANAHVVLRFRYSYTGTKSGFIFSVSPKSFFAAGIGCAWYPQLEEFPRTDDGIRLRGLRSTGSLHFLLPNGWDVYSPGKKTRTDGKIVFKIDQPVFFSFAAAKYSVLETADPMKVSLYELQPRGEHMVDYLKKATHVLQVLSDEFADYPYPEFAIAEVPSDEANNAGFAGASPDGLMLATTDFFNQEFNTAYYGHEIGHQWWGGLVRPEGPEGRWLLTEAMAQYGSLRAVEIIEGSARAELYRRKGYPGYIQDQSGFGYLMLAAAGLDQALTKLPADGSLPRWLADSKGFIVWDMLSRQVGREKFSTVLKAIIEKYTGGRIHWQKFVEETEKLSNEKLGWFFEQWFNRPVVPDWKSEWRLENKTLQFQLSQKSPHFRMALTVVIRGKNGEQVTQTISVVQQNQNWSWDVPFRIESVIVDPNFQVLHWTEEYRKEADALIPYTRALIQQNDGNSQEAMKLYKEGIEKARDQDPYGLKFLLHFGLSQILYDQSQLDDSKTHLEIALNSPVRRPERLPWAYLQLADIADKQRNADLVCSALKSVILADRSAAQKTGASEHVAPLSLKHRCSVPH
jgi:tetratricopeptide (TPR) repeat protein